MHLHTCARQCSMPAASRFTKSTLGELSTPVSDHAPPRQGHYILPRVNKLRPGVEQTKASLKWNCHQVHHIGKHVTPKGVPHLALCGARATREGPWSKLKEPLPRRKIGVTSKTPVGVISVVTLIRTDTTLDHSQKAEKV